MSPHGENCGSYQIAESDMELQQQIEQFLEGAPHAVIGASDDRSKYGNKVLRAYLQAGRAVYPVNPNAKTVEGMKTYAHLRDLPQLVYGISIITPPKVTERVIAEAVELGIQHIWLQPGAENEAAILQATASGANVIAAGPCLLVALRFRDTDT